MPPDLGGRQIHASRSESLNLKGSLAQRVVHADCSPVESARETAQGAESAMVALVRCRQVDWSPSAVVALASSIDGTAVATARESGDIEIWNAAPGSVGWSCELRIPGRDNTTISSLIWSPSLEGSRRGRLFSGDLEGHIIEWDLGSLRPKAVADSHGGSVWSLAMEPTPILPPRPQSRSSPDGELDSSDESSSDSDSDSDSETEDGRPRLRDEEILAVGCDDGCVRLFSIYNGEAGAQFRRALPHVDGRILSLAWSTGPNSRLFAGTSDGCIRCWDVTTLREMYRITVTVGGQKTEDLCVWSLLALRDGTLVSGDGSGSTQFWESKYGTLLQAHRRHSADVLALAATPSQHGVFSAGVDGQIVMFQRTFEGTPGTTASSSLQGQPGGGPVGQWVFAGTRRCHTHDIRALAVATLPWEDEVVVEMKGAERRKRKRQVGRVVNTSKWALPGAAMLVSGGDDARLITYPANAFLSYMPHSVSHTPNPPAIHLANGSVPCGGALMLSQQSQWMDIWHMQERPWHASPAQAMAAAVSGRADNKGLHMTMASTSGVEPETPPYMNGVQEPSKKKKKKGAAQLEVVEVVPASKLNKAGGAAAVMANGNGAHAANEQLAKSRGEGAGSSGATATFVPPRLVARIKLKAKKRHVACSAISPDGRFVACSDTLKCRLFEVALPPRKEASVQGKGSEGWHVSRRLLPEGLGSAHCLLFNADSAGLLVASRDGGIAVVNVEHGTVEHSFAPFCPSLSDDSYCSSGAAPAVTHMCASRDGQWLAAVDACGHISVFNMEAMRHHWSVPRLDDSRPTAMAFHPGSSGALVVATACNRVHVLDAEACALSEWSRANSDRLPQRLLEMPGGITGLAMPPSVTTNSIVVYNSRSMCHIDLSKPVDETERPAGVESPPAKRSRLAIAKERAQREVRERVGASGAGRERGASAPSNFKVKHFEHPCLFLGFPGDGNLLLVEKPWSEVLQGFPSPIQRHKYGT